MPPAAPLIAIVDDDAFVCRALQRLLRASGYAVDTYSSGVQFLQSVEDRLPDCVVLDLHMPGVNGFEVQARLKDRGFRMPVVVITGHHTPEGRARVLGNGAAAYVCKPVDITDLLDAINGALLSGHTDVA